MTDDNAVIISMICSSVLTGMLCKMVFLKYLEENNTMWEEAFDKVQEMTLKAISNRDIYIDKDATVNIYKIDDKHIK